MIKTFPSSAGGSGFDPWSIPGLGRSAREGIGTSILPTPVFWPGKFHGLHSPWGHKESDTTERLLHSGGPAGQSSVACGIFHLAKQPSTDVEMSCPGSL